MKHEWKKHEKVLYGAKDSPGLVDIPAQNFIMIKGSGNPNDTDFSNRVSALYSLAYAIKMDYKATALKNIISNEIHDFTVYPLEGIWMKKDDNMQLDTTNELIKDNLEYTIMIRQPDFITTEMVRAALERVKVKKPNPLYEEIFFDMIHDRKCVEILHIGSYDNEPVSFALMDKFVKENGLHRISDWHREIYLNNANRAKTDKLKTILRYRVG
ncbi:GyrI-like domain-containing protein [Negativibacillus massiliensis]|uniref:GyrI-like domain-containing protein n=1 Tax=Negativibacillus massiliensis TaxID=1871035 RepID=UPI0023F66C01|nr:GyrI-like domain-containing protein [Negativibacillus massiliensis]